MQSSWLLRHVAGSGSPIVLLWKGCGHLVQAPYGEQQPTPELVAPPCEDAWKMAEGPLLA